jgi:Flp pilus assembly protein TadG
MLNLVRTRFVDARSGVGRDAGYVVAMTALLLLPLLAFTGLAVDLGAWYARAAQIQRTTDAAALAGVAWLPDNPGQAVIAAQQVARQNGFNDADSDITVTAVPLVGDRMEVTITDAAVDQYFTTIFRSSVSVTRSSIAEYVPPIRMGSPRNFLGTGSADDGVPGLPGGMIRENFMLSVNGPCDRGEDGDLRLSQRIGNNGTGCPGGIASPTYQSTGYAYGITVNEGYSGGSLAIEVFDAALCKSGGYDLNLGSGNYNTRYTLRAPNVDPFAGTPITTTNVGYDSSACSTWGNQWRSIGTITPTPGEAHVVQVQSHSQTNTGGGAGANNFALRARRTSGAFQACSSDEFETDPVLAGGSVANCPNVFAYQDLSVYAGVNGSSADFFLASIGPEHSGKTLVIELFDPGEGGALIQVQDPNGNLVGPGNPAGVTSFERSVFQRFPTEVAPGGGGWGPFTESAVDILPAGPAAGPGRATDGRCTGQNSANPACRYNERSLRLEIELPNIDEEYGGRTWWRIRYDFNGGSTINVTDRTTWSVSVEGGPVRLIE